jgi:putative ABC transport system permease protein
MFLATELNNAARRLLRRPTQSALVVGVLGLGLGAFLFLLSVVNGLLIRPLPFPDADRLVAMGERRDSGVGGIHANDFLRLRDELRSFERMGVYDEATANISRGGSSLPQRYDGAQMSVEAQQLVGVQPILGRGFIAADDQPGAPAVLLLGERVWREDFGADPAVIGRVLKLNGEAATVVGVLPEDFRFPYIAEVWMPRRLRSDDPYGAQVIAKLADGVSLSQARVEFDTVVERLGPALMAQRDQRPLNLKPLVLRFVNEHTRGIIGMIFVPGALVLLLACLNAANLRLGHALSRQQELAVRGALGASRARLLRELLAESVLLALAATAIGLVIADAAGRWLLAVFIANEDAPAYFVNFGIDLRMFGFALLAALVTALASGLWPALRASKLDLQQGLRAGGRSGADAGAGRAVRALVVAEIALTVLLLVGAGTFLRGLERTFAFDFGTVTPPTEVLTGRIGLRDARYAEPGAKQAFYQSLVEDLEAQPGVRAASVSSALPGTMAGASESVAAAGQAEPNGGWPQALAAHVDPGFAEVYGLELLEGRMFDARDSADSARVVVIDARLAQELWPSGNALGQTLWVNPQRAEPDVYTVVGVIANLHLEDADDPVQPTLLAPLAQHPREFVTVAIRTEGEALGFAPLLAERVRQLDADLPVYWLRTQQRAIEMGRIGPVILSQMFSAIGLLGLVLAASGLYGVLAQAVLARSREIGIRRAIGADARSVLRLVGGGVGLQLAIGLSIGLALALPWSGMLASENFHTRSAEPAVFLAALLVVLLAALAAFAGPLLSALRIDPMQALRQD